MIRFQLQRALAKMSPEKICWQEFTNTKASVPSKTIPLFQWGEEFDIEEETIKDSEWLHICFLIEESLSEKEKEQYATNLYWSIKNLTGSDFDLSIAHVAWQTRAINLCKTKGINYETL